MIHPTTVWVGTPEARLAALLAYIERRLYGLTTPIGWDETQTGTTDTVTFLAPPRRWSVEPPPARPRTAAELIAWFQRAATAAADLAALQAPTTWATPRVDAMRTVHHRPPHMGRQTRKRQPGSPSWARRKRC